MAEGLPEQDEAEAEAARQHMLRAVDAAIEATRNIADPYRAYAAAKLLVEDLRKMTNAGGLVHSQTATRIHDQDPVPYSALARRLGVSKTRAQQMVTHARRAAAGRDGGS